MGELVVNMFTSLDGVLQGPGGPDEDREGGARRPADLRQHGLAGAKVPAGGEDRAFARCGGSGLTATLVSDGDHPSRWIRAFVVQANLVGTRR
jgi:hypothetical protein